METFAGRLEHALLLPIRPFFKETPNTQVSADSHDEAVKTGGIQQPGYSAAQIAAMAAAANQLNITQIVRAILSSASPR